MILKILNALSNHISQLCFTLLAIFPPIIHQLQLSQVVCWWASPSRELVIFPALC